MKRYLLAPGPTQVSPEVLLAMAHPLLHHRAPEFVSLFERVRADLKWLYQTREDVLVLVSTGTGGMEAAVTNFLSPGEKALVINGGKFGERWGKICSSYGVKVEEIKVEWGYAVKPEQIAEALKKHPDIKAVFTQASETSTGVTHDIKAIASVVRAYDDCLMVVDAVSAMGVFDIQTDAWGLDIVVTGSQKALGLPPGLAFVSASQKAWHRAEKTKNSRFYFNLKKERESQQKSQTAFTAATSLVAGLACSLEMLKEEGLADVFARHALLARAMREGVRALGLKLFPKENPSDSVTAIEAPAGVDGQEIYKRLRVTYGITAAGGQDHLKGKVFRIAHMGYMDTFDVILGLSGVEMTLADLGYPVKFGTGVGAAEQILRKKADGGRPA